MTQINAYLSFNGNCREAMTFYKDCLGGELNLQTVENSPMAAQCAESMKHQIMHSELTKNGLLLMATDMVEPEGYIQGNTIALSLNCSSEQEINEFFSNLSDGGKVILPLQEMFWGATFGMLTDKFGFKWMLNYNKSQKES